MPQLGELLERFRRAGRAGGARRGRRLGAQPRRLRAASSHGPEELWQSEARWWSRVESGAARLVAARRC